MSKAMVIAINQRLNNRELYIAMCKGTIRQRSIRSKHGKGKWYFNPGIVMGQGHSYHGHINIEKV